MIKILQKIIYFFIQPLKIAWVTLFTIVKDIYQGARETLVNGDFALCSLLERKYNRKRLKSSHSSSPGSDLVSEIILSHFYVESFISINRETHTMGSIVVFWTRWSLQWLCVFYSREPLDKEQPSFQIEKITRRRLIDYLLFYVSLENISLIWKRHHCL